MTESKSAVASFKNHSAQFLKVIAPMLSEDRNLHVNPYDNMTDEQIIEHLRVIEEPRAFGEGKPCCADGGGELGGERLVAIYSSQKGGSRTGLDQTLLKAGAPERPRRLRPSRRWRPC
jgi:hypothetical protein